MRPPLISQRFSYQEMSDILRNAFNYRGLKDTKFEFCIFSGGGFSSSIFSSTNELKSPNYFPALTDTIHNLQTFYPLVANHYGT